jgi:hypothetical protein
MSKQESIKINLVFDANTAAARQSVQTLAQ